MFPFYLKVYRIEFKIGMGNSEWIGFQKSQNTNLFAKKCQKESECAKKNAHKNLKICYKCEKGKKSL